MNQGKHKLIGKLKSGEAIYVDGEDNIGIEKDHSRLVAPTPEEWKEANRILLNAEVSRPNTFVGASTSAVTHDIIKHDDNPANQAIECQSESRRIEQ